MLQLNVSQPSDIYEVFSSHKVLVWLSVLGESVYDSRSTEEPSTEKTSMCKRGPDSHAQHISLKHFRTSIS